MRCKSSFNDPKVAPNEVSQWRKEIRDWRKLPCDALAQQWKVPGGWVGDTLPETNSSPLQMDGWNTSLSYWVSAYFQGLLPLVSGRVSFWWAWGRRLRFLWDWYCINFRCYVKTYAKMEWLLSMPECNRKINVKKMGGFLLVAFPKYVALVSWFKFPASLHRFPMPL